MGDGIGWVPAYTGNKKCHSCCTSYEFFQEHCANIDVFPVDSTKAGKSVTCPATTVTYRDDTAIDSSKGLRQGFPAKWSPLTSNDADDDDGGSLKQKVPPRLFGNLCVTKGSSDLWKGTYPAKHYRHKPYGKQIGLFTKAMHRYQAYCAKHNLRSMPLYDETGQRPPPAWGENHIKAWSTRLFDEWLSGGLYLPLTDSMEVPLDGVDYGKGQQVCSRLPAVVNWVSDCDCKLDPQCESLRVHKYTHFFGTRRILQSNNIKAPTPLACSYFRQLEVLNEVGIDSFHPHSDYTLKKTEQNPTKGTPKLSKLHLDYDVKDLDNHSAVPKPYPLRKMLKKAMIKEWHDGLGDADRVFRRYYDKCEPFDCYYDEQQEKDFNYFWQAFILAFGGLATVLIAGINGVVNGICSTVEQITGLLGKKIDFRRKDIYELQHSLSQRKKDQSVRRKVKTVS